MENLKSRELVNAEPQPSLRAPPDCYAFNNLIQDFAEEIKGDDVDVIKIRFKGYQIVDNLLQNGYISETNIIYLQQIIRILNRPNLLQKAIDFAKDNGRRILHFRVTTPHIRGDFHAVRIHVEDHGLLKYEDLDTLRHEISKIVLVPPEDVCFAGIEETNSVVITFVLPDMYIGALKMLLINKKKHYHFLSLCKFGVDRINVHEKWYEISENEKKGNGGQLLSTMESTNIEHEKNVEENTNAAIESKKLTWNLKAQGPLHKLKSFLTTLFTNFLNR